MDLVARPNPSHADVLQRIQAADIAGDCWRECVKIAREFGARALNVAKFSRSSPAPLWTRISMHETGGLEEYVKNNFFLVDPVLVPYVTGRLNVQDKVSLFENREAKQLSRLELDCYEHEISCGYSDFLTYRVPDPKRPQEMLVVFACAEQGLRALLSMGHSFLNMLANLFASYIGPPTSEFPDGKIPVLYEFLSPWERDVLSYLAMGLRNEELAFRLGLSEVTVRLYTRNARRKMNAQTREHAIGLAISRGLITP